MSVSMGSRLKHYLSDNGPLILDGGLSTELEAQGFNLQVKNTCFKLDIWLLSKCNLATSV